MCRSTWRPAFGAASHCHPFARLLTTPAQAAAVLGWGPPGARQAQLAAETARERWGLPTARLQHVPLHAPLRWPPTHRRAVDGPNCQVPQPDSL
ncbi:hypothetical protein GCM10017776_28080 [Streptomyces griseoluteus]|nr:hypothetical protein GCM10017776_28080 [Streptomyces griseoluteus]